MTVDTEEAARWPRRGLLGLALTLVLAVAGVAEAQPRAPGRWAAAWAAAPQPAAPAAAAGRMSFTTLDRQTVRQTVRLTVAGSRLRIRLSNEHGRNPLVIGAASVTIAGRTLPVTFGGRSFVRIPPGAPAVSDAVSVTVARMSDVAIALYLPDRTPIETIHEVGLHPTEASGPGDFTREPAFTPTARGYYRVFLTGVAVWTEEPTRVVATLGASIVDGVGSSLNGYANWPDRLAQRLATRPGAQVGVVNLGLGGNQVANDATGVSALARLDRDVLTQPGLTHIILLEGRNDLAALGGETGPPLNVAGHGADADTIFAGYMQVAARAHELGIKVIAAPVTPDATPVWTPRKEAERRKLNALLKESPAFDGFLDIDRVVQNPNGPGLRPEFDSGDHLHLNDAGYRALAEAIDLTLFDAR